MAKSIQRVAEAVPRYDYMTMSVECSNSSKWLHHDQTANMLSLASKQAYRSQSLALLSDNRGKTGEA